VFVTGSLSNQSKFLWLRSKAYFIVENLKGSALAANIRLGWKCSSGTNTLAYYKYLQIAEEKAFYDIGPWSHCCKTFFLITDTADKLASVGHWLVFTAKVHS
jgi:hypothetical protein